MGQPVTGGAMKKAKPFDIPKRDVWGLAASSSGNQMKASISSLL
jgi:hypothetical protein